MAPRFFVGTRKGLFTVERGAGGWEIARVDFLGDEVTAILAEPASGPGTNGGRGRLWVALRLGHFGVKLHRSDDGGKSFHEIAAPTYPPQPDARAPGAGGAGPEDAPVARGEAPGSGAAGGSGASEGSGPPLSGARRDVHWSVSQIWELAAGGGVLWAGDLPGGLHRSDDGGGSWRLVRSLWDRPERRRWVGGGYRLPGLHSISIDPMDPERLLVGISVGGVWASDDGGASWRLSAEGMRARYMPPARETDPNAQDPHRLARCAVRPEVVWCQHHSGVWRSTDAGASWRELPDVPPSIYGFAAAAHPSDPATAWLVPAESDARRVPVDARLVVTRTRDGGESFEVLSRGLPDRHAYHLVLRHALDVDATGERLAMGSNLGGVWVSEDGGTTWETVSAHLPPVNCVRFAAEG